MRTSPSLRFLGLVVAVTLVAGGAACSNDDNDGEATATPGTSATSAAGGNLQGGGAVAVVNDVPDIVEKVQPSVVAIQVTAGSADGAGSGVIWDRDGVIVTNNHVVEGADSLTVVLLSGERIPATLRATDPLTDLAIIEVDRDGLPPAEFADELPRVGELAVAMGNPLGFENTVTSGIVSGLHRAIPSGGTTPALVDLIQSDAAISPGNSGGALVNGRGQVMGINVAYIPPTEGAVAIGFGIPSPTVKDTVGQLLRNGRAEHAFLGFAPRPLDRETATQLGLATSEGVFVFNVTPGSAAEEAGLQPGDVITEFDGQQLTSVEDLYTALRGKKPGDTVDMTVMRGDQEIDLTATLDERPANQP
jgi:S1-C subfamily serine protease